jgi:hypothetical protein
VPLCVPCIGCSGWSGDVYGQPRPECAGRDQDEDDEQILERMAAVDVASVPGRRAPGHNSPQGPLDAEQRSDQIRGAVPDSARSSPRGALIAEIGAGALRSSRAPRSSGGWVRRLPS